MTDAASNPDAPPVEDHLPDSADLLREGGELRDWCSNLNSQLSALAKDTHLAHAAVTLARRTLIKEIGGVVLVGGSIGLVVFGVVAKSLDMMFNASGTAADNAGAPQLFGALFGSFVGASLMRKGVRKVTQSPDAKLLEGVGASQRLPTLLALGRSLTAHRDDRIRSWRRRARKYQAAPGSDAGGRATKLRGLSKELAGYTEEVPRFSFSPLPRWTSRAAALVALASVIPVAVLAQWLLPPLDASRPAVSAPAGGQGDAPRDPPAPPPPHVQQPEKEIRPIEAPGAERRATIVSRVGSAKLHEGHEMNSRTMRFIGVGTVVHVDMTSKVVTPGKKSPDTWYRVRVPGQQDVTGWLHADVLAFE